MNKQTRWSCFLFALIFHSICLAQPNYKSFDDYPGSQANLWPVYTSKSTKFSIWSPLADSVKLRLFNEGDKGDAKAIYNLIPDKNGVWLLDVRGDLQGTYYTYQVKENGKWLEEIPGIYAQATGVNGKRAMVIKLSSTDPAGWANDKGPGLKASNQAIIYEAHVRDFTIDPKSGVTHAGKYLGFTETGTHSPAGLSTGIDHIKEMGVTHVHLLPCADFSSIDETDPVRYNWGYDPQNYNVPEGSYATDVYHAEVRIREFKKMVKAFHDQHLGVVMDMVFNHTATYDHSNYQNEVPGYYYRHWPDGKLSDATACGNEVASERPMTRKYIVASVAYWAKEYHIDGFRFDLMAVLDITTMNAIADTLKKINPNILLYGEGWSAGDSPYPAWLRANKKLVSKMQGYAMFSDEVRDGLKGSVFSIEDKGFVSGKDGSTSSVEFGVLAGVKHPQLDESNLVNGDTAWAFAPTQTVVYVSCHDNNTLYDKLKASRPDASEAEIIAMDKLANAVVLTSQGIPFLHAGVEMLRTKNGVENSYESPDSINGIKWQWKKEHSDVVAYYKNLIQLRKAHPAFYMKTADEVRRHIKIVTAGDGLLTYEINDHANYDTWKNILVIYNAKPEMVHIPIAGKWKLAVDGNEFNTGTTREGVLDVPGISLMIAYQD